MKRAVLAAAFAAAVCAAPAPSILATRVSTPPSASSTDPYPTASCTESYCLNSVSSGLPTPSGSPITNDATSDEITHSIEAWENDVDNVNAFLNKALSLTGIDLATAAQTALNFAQDEPTQLAIECALPNLSQAGKAACTTLQEVFGMVLVGLEGIIADPDWSYTVRQNLDLINEIRCNSVLPSLDVLWPAAAKASGAKIYVPKAQRPAACEIIDGAEEYGQGEEQGEGEDEHEKEDQEGKREEFVKEDEEKYEFEGEAKEGEKEKVFEREGEGEKQAKHDQEKRQEEEDLELEKVDAFFDVEEVAEVVKADEEEDDEEEEEEEDYPGEKDGFPIFPLPPIRRVAKVPVLTGFPPHVDPSVALKITEPEKEGKAEVPVLSEDPLASATATLPTLFIPVPTY